MTTGFDELQELANSDPNQAISLASQIVETSESEADKARALRVAGVAYANLGEFVQARSSLEAAHAASKSAGDIEVIGEVQMTRAGVLAWGGDQPGALAAISDSLDVLSGAARARALAQRGAIHYRLGNFSLARTDLDEAISDLERSDDRMWAGHAFTNRGLLNAYEGRLEEAGDDLRNARDRYAALGHRTAVAQAGQNLGWLALRTGDFPQALNFLEEAEAVFEDLGKSLGELWSDRAEALLAAHLATEAKHVAIRAANELRDNGMQATYADALLQAAQAAILSGDTATASDTARTARRLMEQQGRTGWVAFADYLIMRARAATGDLDGADLPVISRAVAALDDAGLAAEAVHARLLAAVVATEADDWAACRQYLTEASQARKFGPVELRAQGWVAEARLRLHAEDQRGAAAAARAGLNVLDSYQATLGGTQARLHVTGHGAELADIGMRLAQDSGSPRRLFDWMELTRAGALRSHPASTRRDDDLRSYLMQFREADEELRRATLDGRATHTMNTRRARLQEKVRNRALKAPAATAGRVPIVKAGDVLDLLDDAALVEFAETADGLLLAVRLERHRVHKYDLGPLVPIRREIDSLAMALRRIAFGVGSAASRASALGIVAEASDRLGELLVDPLQLRSDRVVIVPVGPLYAVPWALLASLRTRPVTVSPSAALWAQRAESRRRPAGDASVIGGPRLAHSAEEVDRVAAVYTRPTTLVEPTASEAVRAIDGVTIAHVACHGEFRVDNPLFSSLEMKDGPLTVYDLEAVQRIPRVMVLSACDAGANTSSGGQEVMGLATALLGQGTRSVVANVGLVPDQLATIDLMVNLHRGIVGGTSVAESLTAALPALDYEDPDSIAARAFVTFGA